MNPVKRTLSLLTVVTICGLLLSCGGGGSSSPTLNISGSWQFSGTSSVTGGQFSASGTLAQNGSAFTGSLSISGSPCAQAGAFAGTLSGNSFSATLDENGQSVSFTGTVAAGGSSASGSYSAPSGGCTQGDKGTWSGSLVSPADGQFTGELLGDVIPVRIFTTLHNVDGTVDGVAAFTNSACLSAITIQGTVVADSISLHGFSEGREILTAQGKADLLSGNIALDYSIVDGNCSGRSGTGVLLKQK